MLKHLENCSGGALFVEMRLGKTLVVCKYLKGMTLIVAPFSAFNSWIEEAQFEGLPIITTEGSSKKRIAAINSFQRLHGSRSAIVLINKEAYKALQIHTFSWSCVVLDEAHFIKNPKAKVTKYFLKHFRDVKQKIILTGTPRTNSDLDYISELLFINEKVFADMSYWVFRAKCCYCYAFSFSLKKNGRKLLEDALKKYAYTLTREQAGIFVQKVYVVRTVALSTKLQKVYRKIVEEFELETDNGLKQTNLSICKYLWMRRLCGGFIDGGLVAHEKLKELKELVDGELLGQQIVVWAVYHLEIQAILKMFKGKAEAITGKVKPSERMAIVNRFQLKKTQILVIIPDAMKAGSDLSVASTAIYYSCPDSYEARKQSEDRILSLTKEESLLIIDLQYKDTIDQKVLKSVNTKDSRQQFWNRIGNSL